MTTVRYSFLSSSYAHTSSSTLMIPWAIRHLTLTGTRRTQKFWEIGGLVSPDAWINQTSLIGTNSNGIGEKGPNSSNPETCNGTDISSGPPKDSTQRGNKLRKVIVESHIPSEEPLTKGEMVCRHSCNATDRASDPHAPPLTLEDDTVRVRPPRGGGNMDGSMVLVVAPADSVLFFHRGLFSL